MIFQSSRLTMKSFDEGQRMNNKASSFGAESNSETHVTRQVIIFTNFDQNLSILNQSCNENLS